VGQNSADAQFAGDGTSVLAGGLACGRYSARASEVSIYSVAQGLDERTTLRAFLDQLADQTGGRSYFIGSIEKLPATFSQILRELKSQYFLTYTPAPSVTARESAAIVQSSGPKDVIGGHFFPACAGLPARRGGTGGSYHRPPLPFARKGKGS